MTSAVALTLLCDGRMAYYFVDGGMAYIVRS